MTVNKFIAKNRRKKGEAEIQNKCKELLQNGALKNQTCKQYVLDNGITLDREHYKTEEFDRGTRSWILEVLNEIDAKIVESIKLQETQEKEKVTEAKKQEEKGKLTKAAEAARQDKEESLAKAAETARQDKEEALNKAAEAARQDKEESLAKVAETARQDKEEALNKAAEAARQDKEEAVNIASLPKLQLIEPFQPEVQDKYCWGIEGDKETCIPLNPEATRFLVANKDNEICIENPSDKGCCLCQIVQVYGEDIVLAYPPSETNGFSINENRSCEFELIA